MPARAQVFRAVAEDASSARDSAFIFRIIFPGELYHDLADAINIHMNP